MITAPLPRAPPSGSGRLSMIIPRYYELTITSIMNKSQELTVFHGRQKLTSVMKQRPEK